MVNIGNPAVELYRQAGFQTKRAEMYLEAGGSRS